MLYQNAETFIKDIFSADIHQKNTLNLKENIYKKIKEDVLDKDPDYYGMKDGEIHASSLTACLRGVALQMLGATPDKEPDDRKLGVFWMGQRLEDMLIDRMGDKVIERQREYKYKYKSLTLVGRSDFTVKDGDIERIGEIKSVQSRSFWYREKEGNIVAWHNLVQLQIYMWLERILFNKQPQGLFLYVSKDDCTLSEASVRFSQEIIDKVVIPALDYLNEAYEKQDAFVCPLPDTIIWNVARKQYQRNWLATYCDFHQQCLDKDWEFNSAKEVARLNKHFKETGEKLL